MSVQSAKISNSVEFERREAHLSNDDADGPPYTIHGVALGENDVTFGTSGIKKVWPAGELERSAHTLQNTNLVVDHSQRAVDVVGKVTKAGYKDGVGIIYEAELYDEDLAEKVQHGLLEVSIRGYHIDVDEMSEDDNGAKIVEDIEFDNLSIVPQGASPSNTLEMGAHAELSAAELIAFTETLDVATLAVSEPGQWVKWEDNRGITVSMPSDGKIDVDVYQLFDGTWRSTGNVKTVDVDSLSEWDVEEDDVGSEADKEEASYSNPFNPGQMFYSPMNDEMIEIVDTEPHRARMRDEDGDTWYKTYDSIMERLNDDVWIMAPSEVEIGDVFRSAVNSGMVRIMKRERGQALVQSVNSPDSTWWDRVVDIQQKIRDGAWEPVDRHAQMGYAEMAPTEDFMFDSEDEAMEIVESDEFNILTGVHSHDMDGKTVWMPGADMDEFNRWHEAKHADMEMSSDIPPYAHFLDDEELASPKYTRGDWVSWNTRNSTEKGTVYGSYMEGDDLPDFRGDRGMSPEGDEVLYALRMYKERDGTWHPITGGLIGHYEDSVRSIDEPANVSESPVELSDNAHLQALSELADDPMVSRPEEGERRATFHTPLPEDATEEGVMEAVSIAEDELGLEISVSVGDEGVFVEPIPDTGVGIIEFMHPHLDIIESAFKNTTGILQKSTTFIGGDAEGYSIQPCFMMDDRLPDAALDEISRLYEFVTGVTTHAYYNENRLYLDTRQNELAHANLDIAEILVRRTADDAEIGIQSHSFKVLEETSAELGRSNVAQYDVEADQWVQWYPSDTTEKHGYATSVSDDEVTIEVWTQLSDGTWKKDGDTVTKSMDEVEPWGNFPRKQEDFAIDGEDPRRAVRPSEEASNGLSEQTETALRNKVESHNEEHGDKDGKRVTYRMLKSVYNRGGGAYDDSHREGMSRQQWSMARVNAFLYLVRNGNPENDAYVQDNDLLPDGHPKRTEEAAIDAPEFYDDQVVYWQVNPDMMGKVVHVDESRDIVMVEIIEEEDGMYMPSGFTVSAGYSDIMPFGADSMNSESLETRYDDYPKAAQENAQMALDAREDTGNPNDCGTDVGWLRARQLADGRGVTREQLGKMSAFARHRQNAEMDPDEGREDCGWMMWKAWGGDEGVEWAQRKLEQIEEENMEYDELQDYDFHDVNYDGTTEESWDAPTLEQIMDAYDWSDEYDSYDDLPESAQETIGDHFLISMSGFPAENFGDYKLPVVDLEGRLSVRGLAAAKGGRGVSRVSGLSDDMEETIVEYINELANDEFDREWGMEEAAYNDMMMEEYMYETPEEAMEAGKEMGLEGVHMHGEMYCPGETHQDLMDAVASMGMYGDSMEEDEEEEMSQRTRADSLAVLTSDDLRRRNKSEESELDSLTTAKIINMSNITEELQAALEELEAPVAVEQADLESLQEKASKYDDISEDISELRERTEVLDDVNRELVEELAEAEEPLVIESARYETLSDEAEHVKTIYAEGLSDELGLFEPEELMERFSIEELREKFDEHVGDIDEELSPAPKAGDAAEEELEAKAEDTKSEEELSLEDEVRSKQQELREKIFQ